VNDADQITPPKPCTGDATHAVVRAGLGSIPLVGAAATELFNWLFKPPMERRRDEWMREVGECLMTLEGKHGVDLTRLRDDDSFFDVVMQATHVALRNSHAEKREALRNAILNTALPQAPEGSQRQMFLNYVDVFTVWHLRLLHLFDDPPKWFRENAKPWPNQYMGSRTAVLDAAYLELRDQRDLYDQVWRDLHARGLVGTDSLHGMVSEVGLGQGLTTTSGKTFLAFISEPTPTK